MRNPFVVDCSVSAAWFIPLEKNAPYETLLSDILDGRVEMIVPDLWWYEVMNVIRSAALRKRIQASDMRELFLFLRDIPKKVVAIGEEGQFGILKMAVDRRLSVYDATYLFLAISSGSRLITSDTDLLRLRNPYSIIRDISEYK